MTASTGTSRASCLGLRLVKVGGVLSAVTNEVTTPATRGLPTRSLTPVVTLTLTVEKSRYGVVGVNDARVWSKLRLQAPAMGPLDPLTSRLGGPIVAGLIGSEKRTSITVVTDTPLAPFAGVMDATLGGDSSSTRSPRSTIWPCAASAAAMVAMPVPTGSVTVSP